MHYRELRDLINRGDYEVFREKKEDIVDYIDFEIRYEGEGEYEYDDEMYLLYQIAAHEDHAMGRILFQIFKSACCELSQYRWTEVMALMGRSLMCGAVESQNISLLEHAMCHVDEVELYGIIADFDEDNPVVRWYDENFVSM